jgi:hypothetical protein
LSYGNHLRAANHIKGPTLAKRIFFPAQIARTQIAHSEETAPGAADAFSSPIVVKTGARLPDDRRCTREELNQTGLSAVVV